MKQDTAQQPSQSAEKITEMNQNYISDKRKSLLGLLIMQTALLASLGLYIFIDFKKRPQPVVFNVNDSGQLIQPMPLTKPSMDAPALLNWVTEGVIAAYSFNFMNINQHPKRLGPYFDQQGYSRFINILTKDNNMKRVISDKLIVSAVATAAPELIKEGVYRNEFFVWLVKLPIEVRLSNIGILRRQSLDVTIGVRRVPELDNPLGVRITSFKVDVKSETKPSANLLPQRPS